MSQAEHCFTAMSVEQAQLELQYALRHVCQDNARVEITNGRHTGVLIGKEELEALERALEILSNTSEVRRVARQIAALTNTIANGPLIAVPLGGN